MPTHEPPSPTDPRPADEPTADRSDRTASEGALERAVALVHFLRANCPWDAEQTPRTLVPHLLEEAHEVVDAIHSEDSDALAAELGDLLLNLAFQVALGEEEDAFSSRSVFEGLEAKMKRRHPHLYGLGERQEWESLKHRERSRSTAGGPRGVLSGIASGLDPLTKAHRVQERVSGVGFDWPDAGGAWEKVREELEEVRDALGRGEDEALEEELGDLLFAVVNLVRLAGRHGSVVLAEANRKFIRRFEGLEALAEGRGISLIEADLAQLDRLWDEVKSAEKG